MGVHRAEQSEAERKPVRGAALGRRKSGRSARRRKIAGDGAKSEPARGGGDDYYRQSREQAKRIQIVTKTRGRSDRRKP